MAIFRLGGGSSGLSSDSFYSRSRVLLAGFRQSNTVSNAAVSASTIYLYPILMPYSGTITKLITSINAIVAGNGQMAIYTNAAVDDIRPVKLLYSSSSFSTNTTGPKIVTPSLSVNQNDLLWLAVNCDGAANFHADITGGFPITIGPDSTDLTVQHSYYTYASTFNTWPDPLVAGTLVGAYGNPLIRIGVQYA